MSNEIPAAEELAESLVGDGIFLSVEGNGFVIVSSPELDETDDIVLCSDVETPVPFKFITAGDISDEEAAELLEEKFQERIDRIISHIEESGKDPIEAVQDMDLPDLVQ